jgi:hypothetical protein
MLGGPLTRQEAFFTHRLRAAITSGKDRADLASMTDFEWDTVCAIDTAYLDGSDVASLIKIDSPAYHHTSWIGNSGFWGLFFVTASRSVVPIRVPNGLTGTFLGGRQPGCATRNQAIIGGAMSVCCVESEGDGSPFLVRDEYDDADHVCSGVRTTGWFYGVGISARVEIREVRTCIVRLRCCALIRGSDLAGLSVQGVDAGNQSGYVRWLGTDRSAMALDDGT